jgi:hypothetical protein
MAKRKAAKTTAGGKKTTQSVEPMVIALAEQLGSFMGRVQKKADGWLENETLATQVSQIRDGAAQLLEQVNRASAAVSKAAKKSVGKSAAKPKGKSAAKASKGRSGGTVDAPGKRHRKPPPQELFDPRLGEPMGKQMGQKSLKRRGRG